MMTRKGYSTRKDLRQSRLAALLAAACLLLGLSVVSACVEPLTPEEKLDPLSRELTIRITLPGGAPQTKITGTPPYDIASVDPESMLYNIQVWMFNHQAADADARDGEKAVSYTETVLGGWANTQDRPSGYYDAWSNTTTYEVPLVIPGYIMDREASNMKFDFYVLANKTAIGSSLDRSATRADLKAATFGQGGTADPFGPTDPKTGATPLAAINNGQDSGPGLPISGFFNRTKNTADGSTEPHVGEPDGVDISFLKTNPQITAADMQDRIPVVQLTRAVGKLRFAFAKATGQGGVQITRIEIYDHDATEHGLVPDKTYVFPREDGTEFALPADATYPEDAAILSGTGDAPLLASDAIAGVTDPEALRSDSDRKLTADQAHAPAEMTAQEYESFLSDNATIRLVYLRESGKPVKGRIYYKLSADGQEKSAAFDMTAADGYDEATTNLHRNHYWTVFAYFKGGALYLKPVVLPWTDGGSYDFTTPGTANVSTSSSSQAIFGYGWSSSTENAWYTAGKPTEWYFRRQDQSSAEGATPVTYYAWNDWVHSQVVSAPGLNVANAPVYANRIELTTAGFDEILRLKLTNPTDFRLVIYHSASAAYEVFDTADGAQIPASVAASGVTYFYVVPKDAAAEGCKTGVYLITDGTHQKIPFNAGVFPGSNENTEIYFYGVSQSTFQSYYTTLPENVQAYNLSAAVVSLTL